MLRRFMGWVLLPIMAWSAADSAAEDRTPLVMAVDQPGTDSFTFGVRLWALSEIELLPKLGIDLDYVSLETDGERLAALREGQADIALLAGDVPTADARQIRTMMTLWPEAVTAAAAKPGQLVVRADVDEAAIYAVTRIIFEQPGSLTDARATLGVVPPEEGLVGAALPVHQGAERFYQEAGVGRQTAGRPGETRQIPLVQIRKVPPARPETPGAVLEDRRPEDLADAERLQLIAACQYARSLGAAGLLARPDILPGCGEDNPEGFSTGRGGPSEGVGGTRQAEPAIIEPSRGRPDPADEIWRRPATM
jgi:hypothetical protein